MKNTESHPTHCQQCNAPFPLPPPNGGASGYAITRSDMYICYACADAQQREELKDTSRPFVGYVSSDARAITTWTGGHIMRVVSIAPCKLTRWSYTHGKSYFSIRARDVHGHVWYGRGSPGIAIRLRAVKPSRPSPVPTQEGGAK